MVFQILMKFHALFVNLEKAAEFEIVFFCKLYVALFLLWSVDYAICFAHRFLMPTIGSILKFMTRTDSCSCKLHEKSFISLGAWGVNIDLKSQCEQEDWLIEKSI